MKPNPALLDDHEMNMDPLCEQMTVETFEAVVNKPATGDELSASHLASAVVTHKISSLVFKSILHQMMSLDWEGTQQLINETVINQSGVDGVQTALLDISWRN